MQNEFTVTTVTMQTLFAVGMVANRICVKLEKHARFMLFSCLFVKYLVTNKQLTNTKDNSCCCALEPP